MLRYHDIFPQDLKWYNNFSCYLTEPIDSWPFLQKVRFLDILVIFRLDLAQSTSNRVENAFTAQQLAFLATSIAF